LLLASIVLLAGVCRLSSVTLPVGGPAAGSVGDTARRASTVTSRWVDALLNRRRRSIRTLNRWRVFVLGCSTICRLLGFVVPSKPTNKIWLSDNDIAAKRRRRRIELQQREKLAPTSIDHNTDVRVATQIGFSSGREEPRPTTTTAVFLSAGWHTLSLAMK